MKDINYLEINKEFNEQLLRLDTKKFIQLKTLIKMDSEFLKNHNLMDYSLLMAIEMVKVEPESTAVNKDSSSIGFSDQKSNGSGLNRNKVSSLRSLIVPQNNRLKFVSSGTENAESYQQVVHISIIDFLQDWSLSKKVERRLKGNSTKISAVPPSL